MSSEHIKIATAFILTTGLTACSEETVQSSGSDSENIGTSGRFVQTTVDEERTITDSDTDLMWVNGLEPTSTKAETGCNPLPAGLAAMDAIAEARMFCDMLDFSGYDDWRVPTVMEIQDYTVTLDGEGIIPFYQISSCLRVVGVDTAPTDTIQTVDTHNNPPVGTINNWFSSNAGTRCVRDDL